MTMSQDNVSKQLHKTIAQNNMIFSCYLYLIFVLKLFTLVRHGPVTTVLRNIYFIM